MLWSLKYIINGLASINCKMHKLSRYLTILIFCSLFPLYSCAEEKTVGGDFELTSHLNEPYSFANSRGKVVLVFFGFTHCPDICPNTLSTVQTVLGTLGDQAKHVQPLFITVDPKRDTPEILEKYLGYFDNTFIGLTGTIEEIDKVVEKYRGFYSYEGDVTAGSYTVDHTSNLYIINTEGLVTNIIPYGLPPQAITENIEKLLSQSTS